VPVSVSSYGDIRSLDLTILYDTNQLDLSNADATLGQAGAGWTLVQNANDSIGKLRLTLYRAETMEGGPGEIIDLAFHIPLATASGASAVSLMGDIDEGQVALSSSPGTVFIDAVAPKVAAAVFDSDGGTHSLTVTFSENVGASLSLNAVTVTNTLTDQTIDRAAMVLTYDPTTFKAVITFPGLAGGILPDGDYRLTIAAANVTDFAGNPLDGQAFGTGGGDFDFGFYQLLGDLNRDHFVDQGDRTILTGAMSGGTIIVAQDGDTNGDHQVNFADLVAVAQHYGQNSSGAGLGDLIGDGSVGFADLVAVAQHYGRDGRGDLNGDGLINQSDLDLLDAILNPPAPAAAAAVAASFDDAAVVAAAPVIEEVAAVNVPMVSVATTSRIAPVVRAGTVAKPLVVTETVKAGVSKPASNTRQTATVVAPTFNATKRIKQSWLESGE
jgi:hypothetical protein